MAREEILTRLWEKSPSCLSHEDHDSQTSELYRIILFKKQKKTIEKFRNPDLL